MNEIAISMKRQKLVPVSQKAGQFDVAWVLSGRANIFASHTLKSEKKNVWETACKTLKTRGRHISEGLISKPSNSRVCKALVKHTISSGYIWKSTAFLISEKKARVRQQKACRKNTNFNYSGV